MYSLAASLLLLAATTLPTTQSFVTTTTTLSSATTCNAVQGRRPSFLPRAQSHLRMALFDDMMDNANEAQRSSENKAYLAQLQKRVDKINAMEPRIEDLGDDELQAKTKDFQARLAKGEDINGPLLEEAFAVVREAAWYVCTYLLCLCISISYDYFYRC